MIIYICTYGCLSAAITRSRITPLLSVLYPLFPHLTTPHYQSFAYCWFDSITRTQRKILASIGTYKRQCLNVPAVTSKLRVCSHLQILSTACQLEYPLPRRPPGMIIRSANSILYEPCHFVFIFSSMPELSKKSLVNSITSDG